MCRYAWWGEGALEAANDTKSFFVDANYEITDRAEFFARGLFSYNDVTGRYAASPVWQLTMSEDTPQNPTNPDNPTNYRGDSFGGQSVEVDTDGDGVPDSTLDGPFDVSIFYRNVPGGNRDHGWDDTLLDYVAGVRGSFDLLGGSDWELAAQWSEQTSRLIGQGEALYQILQTEIDDGSFDLFGVSGPYGQDEKDSAQRATATRSGDARHRITGGDGQIAFDAFQLKNGPMPVVLGFEYRDEDFDLGFDEQTQAGAFGGDTADIQNQSGARVIKSLFAETVIPVLPQLEFNLAARYDDYNDFGTTVNPKVSIAFRPLDTLLLRGSYGTGFRAPEMEVLYEPLFTTDGYFVDTWRCSQTDADTDGDGRPNVPEDDLPQFHPCRLQQYDQVLFGGNPDLQPEESDNWTAGFVWNPTTDLSLILDYYNITIDDQIGYPDEQAVLDEEFRLRQAGEAGARVGDVVRHASGRLEEVYTAYVNTDRVETAGIDAEASYSFSVRRLGDFSATLLWTHVLSYEMDIGDGNGTTDWAGAVGSPEDRGQLTLVWALGDYSATIVGNYVSDQKTREWWWNGDDVHIASFTTWDVQASYSTPWNGQVTVGARNVLDRDPPYDGRWGIGYDQWQHEVYGRVPYLRLEQDF
jgi:iron complex outermembrane receptor protein